MGTGHLLGENKKVSFPFEGGTISSFSDYVLVIVFYRDLD